MGSGRPPAPVIFIIAGVNGAGKSSLGGAVLDEHGIAWFNPDAAADRIREEIDCSVAESNSLAWHEGRRRLASAIENLYSFALETTLGGKTIPAHLIRASRAGFDVVVWFIGLTTAELHRERVRSRVAAGGHDIPEEKISERWVRSRENVIALLPFLTELRVFDNSAPRDPEAKTIPPPRLLLHWKDGRIAGPSVRALEGTPEWAKPIATAAMRLQRS